MKPKIAIQVPIKGKSERVYDKNFRKLGDRPLWRHLTSELVTGISTKARLILDCDRKAVERVEGYDALIYPLIQNRPDYLSEDWVNGNHLLQSFANRIPADIYVQAFVTSPFLKASTIACMVQTMLDQGCDSAVAGTYQGLFVWQSGQPNYLPGVPEGFGRTQDNPLFVESTGVYAITREALIRQGARTSRTKTLRFPISPVEAWDIDTEFQFQIAELIYANNQPTDQSHDHNQNSSGQME